MRGMTIAKKALRRLESMVLAVTREVPKFEVERFDSYAGYREHLDRSSDQDATVARAEMALIPAAAGPFRVPGYCGVCGKWSRFFAHASDAADGGGERQVPNWRESLICPSCGLNNRMRACFQLFRDCLRPSPDASIYMTEQATPLFARIKSLYPNTVGSEFLSDGTTPGKLNSEGVRCEDLTRLSFADDQFDFILSFEVLEHIPEYTAAIRECARVLKPGGTLIVTVPFHGKPTTTVRARVGPQGIEHILAPEYHGDPLSSDGCLCFYHFGGDFLDVLHDAGFREVKLSLNYSRALGNLSRNQPIFIATK